MTVDGDEQDEKPGPRNALDVWRRPARLSAGTLGVVDDMARWVYKFFLFTRIAKLLIFLSRIIIKL